LLSNGKKTALLLGNPALHGEALESAGRIAARTGAGLLGEVLVPRLERGEGRVPVQLIPYLREMAAPLLSQYEQLILVGSLPPVTTFAYQGAPVVKVPASCQVTTFATGDQDLTAALKELAAAVGAPAQPVTRQSRSSAAMPAGALNADAIGQSLCALLPENAILVNEGITLGLTIYQRTQGARAHDYLDAGCGGALGAGLPVALGAAVACPSRKTVVLQGDGAGMYAVQALWSLAREKCDVVVVVLKNNQYAILEVELARVCEGDANGKMQSTMHLDSPTLDWVKLAEGQGVPATRVTTAEEFNRQFEAAMGRAGPQLIEAVVADDIRPLVELVRRMK
jgi:acetolactate synthase-1/2/3 large subunit